MTVSTSRHHALRLTTVPEEIILLVSEYLTGRDPDWYDAVNPYERRRFSDSKDLLSFSSSCRKLYLLFRPDRYRSIRLGGAEADLEYAQWILNDSGACQLVKHLKITSLSPLKEALDEPYTQLISELTSLQTFSYFDHPARLLPLPIVTSLSSPQLHPNLISLDFYGGGFLLINSFVGMTSEEPIKGLRGVVAVQNYSPTDSHDRYEPRVPAWLVGHPPADWPRLDKEFASGIALFLARQAPTLETLTLRSWASELGGLNNVMLAMLLAENSNTSLSDLFRLHSGSSQADIASILSQVISFPSLTSFEFGATDLTNPIFPSFLLAAPNLRHLDLQHNTRSNWEEPFRLLYIPASSLLQLETLKISVNSESLPKLVEALEGKSLRELVYYSLEISRDDLVMIAAGLGKLEKLELYGRWNVDDASEIFTALSPLKSLCLFKANFPAFLTSPPNLFPNVQVLAEREGLSGFEIIVELEDFFYGREPEDSEEEDAAESDEDPPEETEISPPLLNSPQSAFTSMAEPTDPSTSILPHSGSASPISSPSAHPFPFLLPPNANLQYFISLVKPLALQHPKLETFYWNFDRAFGASIEFVIRQTPLTESGEATDRQSPSIWALLDAYSLESIPAHMGQVAEE